MSERETSFSLLRHDTLCCHGLFPPAHGVEEEEEELEEMKMMRELELCQRRKCFCHFTQCVAHFAVISTFDSSRRRGGGKSEMRMMREPEL